MKAATSLLAALLMLSFPSLAQTASVQPPSASTPSTEAAAATGDAVPAVPAVSIAPSFAPVPFAAGAKLFLEPMNGFELRISDAILKKKVPVVLVKEREQADFILSGGAHVHKRGFFTGMVLRRL